MMSPPPSFLMSTWLLTCSALQKRAATIREINSTQLAARIGFPATQEMFCAPPARKQGSTPDNHSAMQVRLRRPVVFHQAVEMEIAVQHMLSRMADVSRDAVTQLM